MKRSIKFGLAMGGMLVAVGGCSGDKETIIKEVPFEPVCSSTHPQGLCDAGETCFGGECVLSASLCSPFNLDGLCAEGAACFSGGCIAETALCSETVLDGPCEIGATCFEGSCVTTASLCSSSNPAGLCATGTTCIAGVCGVPAVDPCTVHVNTTQPEVVMHTDVSKKSILTVDGFQFKDLSDDGALQPFEDWRLSDLCRARDLVTRMSIEQKVGIMSEGSRVGSGTEDGSIPDNVRERIVDMHERYALVRVGQRTAAELAVYLNNVQELAEAQPLGIPVTITADPIHGFGMSTDAVTGEQSINPSTVVTPWPYPLGLGAINDPNVTRQYGDTVREEFKAMGFRWQLGPMADLGTEPRWARVQNVFGENAWHVAMHVEACVSGFQAVGEGGLKHGIASTMKHFPGAGPNEDGMDSHSYPGRYNVYPGDFFDYHLMSFQAAIDVGVAAVMPCYSIFEGQTSPGDQLGAAFSFELITTLLKEEMGFTGMVTADWGALRDGYMTENLSQPQRLAMFLHAGSDQLGSDSEQSVRDAYDLGYISMEDIDRAATKILEMTFRLGLFENPYVDPAAPGIRSADNRTNGFIAQKKAIVLLKNNAHEDTARGALAFLPIDGSRFADVNENEVADPDERFLDTTGDGVIKVYYDGVVDGLVANPDRPDDVTDVYGEYDYRVPATATALAIEQATGLADADIAVLRITARKGVYFGLDAGVPLSFDGPFPGASNDSTIAASIKDRNKVIDLLRARDGYTDADGIVVDPVNPNLRIVVVMHMDRPGIVKPFVNGLVTLDELPGEPGSYPLVSDEANIDQTGLRGIDGFLVEFGAFDRAVLDFLFNVNVPEDWAYGRAVLPMEIPSSDAEVEAQFEDLPNDTEHPTYMLGAGMTY